MAKYRKEPRFSGTNSRYTIDEAWGVLRQFVAGEDYAPSDPDDVWEDDLIAILDTESLAGQLIESLTVQEAGADQTLTLVCDALANRLDQFNGGFHGDDMPQYVEGDRARNYVWGLIEQASFSLSFGRLVESPAETNAVLERVIVSWLKRTVAGDRTEISSLDLQSALRDSGLLSQHRSAGTAHAHGDDAKAGSVSRCEIELVEQHEPNLYRLLLEAAGSTGKYVPDEIKDQLDQIATAIQESDPIFGDDDESCDECGAAIPDTPERCPTSTITLLARSTTLASHDRLL